MRELDGQEKLIVKELIKDPRISDNQICANVQVPLKTVNRKRKKLEDENLINYFSYLNNNKEGTKTFNASCMYIIVFESGITKKRFLDVYSKEEIDILINTKHILNSYLGELNGSVALIMTIESNKYEDIIEIFNAEIVPQLHRQFGSNCIKDTITLPIDKMLRLLHNYLPSINMHKGKIKKDIPDDHIFVSD